MALNSTSLPFGLTVLALAVGCGDSTAGSGGANGTGVTVNGATTVTSVTSVTGASTSTGMITVACGQGGTGNTEDECNTTNFDPNCGPCLTQQCCGIAKAAGGDSQDPDLIACAKQCCLTQCYPAETSDYNFECAPPTTSPSNGACVAISGMITCNPITNEGCNTAAGEACDRQIDTTDPLVPTTIGFKCYTDSNIHDVCQPCNDGLGYCKPGLSCFADCGKFCCADSDCSPGTCQKVDASNDPIFAVDPSVGLCTM